MTWMDWVKRLAAAISLTALVILTSASPININNFADFLLHHGGRKQTQTFAERITALTNSLNDAASQVSEIEEEIARRQQLAEQLQAQADLSKKISTLNADQVAAVAQALRGELHNETRSEFWSNTLTNVFFAFLGAAFGEVFRIVRTRRRPSALQNS